MLKWPANPSSQHSRNFHDLTITATHLCSPSPSPSPDFSNQTSPILLAGYHPGDYIACGPDGRWSYIQSAGEGPPSVTHPSMPDRVRGQRVRAQQSPLSQNPSPYPIDLSSSTPDEHPVSPTLLEKFKALNRPSPRAHRQQLNNLGQRSSHRRLPSGSSIGSAGPESPYPHTVSNPHIVGLDTPLVSSPHSESLEIGYQGSTQSQAPSPFINPVLHEELLAPEFQHYHPYSSDPNIIKAAETAMARALEEQGRVEMSRQRHEWRQKSPYDALDEGRPRIKMSMSNAVPLLDRTVSDACQDELYNPSMAMMAPGTDRSPYASVNYPPSQQNPMFTNILQAANEKHLSAQPALIMSREHSPFRQTSEFATENFPHTASTPHSPAPRVNPAGSPREPQEFDAAARNYHLPTMQRDTAPASTISPKESLLNYHEAEANARVLLFPPEPVHRRENQFPSHSHSQHLARSDVGNHDIQPKYDHPRTSRRTNFSTSTNPNLSGQDFTFTSPSLPSVPSNVSSMPSQYPFISNSRRHSSSRRSPSDLDPDPPFPAQLSSMDSTKSEADQPPMTRFMVGGDAPQPSSSSSDVERPSDTVAGTGSYTCTVSGCSQRFDTSARLHKHKRDAHRADPPQRSPATPTLPSSATGDLPAGSSSSHNNNGNNNNSSSNGNGTSNNATNRNNQAGPHRCTRLNPNTNKPCNTVFSRSYDLTRHDETVHNRSKVKIQCALCTVEKTFSRGDALSRHARVMHPGVEYPGKTKKRGS